MGAKGVLALGPSAKMAPTCPTTHADLLHKSEPRVSASIAEVKKLVPMQGGGKEQVGGRAGGWVGALGGEGVPVCLWGAWMGTMGRSSRGVRPPQQLPPPSPQAVVTFNLDADLRSVFSWNTKQIFMFLQVGRLSCVLTHAHPLAPFLQLPSCYCCACQRGGVPARSNPQGQRAHQLTCVARGHTLP